MSTMLTMGRNARDCAAVLAICLSDKKNDALKAIAAALVAHCDDILAANAIDLENADKNGMSSALRDRLLLTEGRIEAIAAAVLELVALRDPVGQNLGGETRPNGLNITKVSVPLGVIGIIYESRANVTVDCAALCLKSGNCCILRGGSEAIHSNTALTNVMREAIASAGLPEDCIQLVTDTARETATEMMRLNGYIDVLIPRGGKGLIRAVVENATVPVIETGAGVCHVYVDESADLGMALSITENAKVSRPSVCNACECVLVHERIAQDFLPSLAARLLAKSVELRCCPKSHAIIGAGAGSATPEDFGMEFGDYILAVKVVSGLDEAVAHIAAHSTHHSDAIVTRCYDTARQFTARVDSAAVYVNASTRFTDGGEFGLGAEIGISTQKLHARGPMGLESLTSSKYIITGNGHIR